MVQFTECQSYNEETDTYEKCAIFEHFNDKLNDETLEELKDYKKVIFDCRFNQPIDNLPNNIEYIEFNNLSEKYESKATEFNQSVENLPKNLKTLILRVYKFDHSLDLLPESLETLLFECQETICIDGGDYDPETGMRRIYFNCLPRNLKELIININNFNSPLNSLPNSLERLTLSNLYTFSDLQFLPNNLKYLSLRGHLFCYDNEKNKFFPKFPDTIEELVFNNVTTQFNKGQNSIFLKDLPKNLKTICSKKSHIQIYDTNQCLVHEIKVDSDDSKHKINSKYDTIIEIDIKNKDWWLYKN